jgi:hypothetical protein
MLKRLFYASASILMLAAAYHLGASSATAQARSASALSGTITAPGLFKSVGDHYTAVIGRTFYESGSPLPVPIPETVDAIATGFGGTNADEVMLANGNVYSWNGSGWTYHGNVVGGVTAASAQSWGAMKARYR